ncbi:MAG: metallophosphoesterase [Bacteroidales bacterium]|nr:metallophosphoesterase [Bacteroidales bacterium]
MNYIAKKAYSLILFLLLFIPVFLHSQTFTEILGRPTNHSVTVSVLFYQQEEFYLEYGLQPGNYTQSTTSISNVPGTPVEIEINGLSADNRYYYRTRYRQPGMGSYLAGEEHSFHTQRAKGSLFTFTVEADEHLYDKKGNRNLYKICLANQAADQPDFMFSLGDIFGDDHEPYTITSQEVKELHRQYLPFLGEVCHSVPFYVCLGNHEGEFNYYLLQNPHDNLAVWSTLWRKFYYPNPFPNDFYSGNTDQEPNGIGFPENYYSWTWGDAQFVVLDAYRYQCDTSAKPKNWAWTLGQKQYDWLKNTLEQSTSKYRIVFIHQLRGQGRGGVVNAPYFEWGGYEQNGTSWGFDSKRPGWAKPIHQLLVDNGVNILFHGHDHLFAHETLDGVVYQEVPMPSDSTYRIGMLANADAYVSDTIGGSGHLRVKITPECIKVDFVSAWLQADTASGMHRNREVAFSYSVGTCSSQHVPGPVNGEAIEVFPNPARDHIRIRFARPPENFTARLTDLYGQTLVVSGSGFIPVESVPPGLYFLNIRTRQYNRTVKVVIQP